MGRKKHGTGLGYRVVEIDESTNTCNVAVYLYLEQMRLSNLRT